MIKKQITTFQHIVREHYRQHGRQMPWRTQPIPYFVFVSEIMLQQTQVSRVYPKFQEFLQRFPDVTTLAQAPLGDVLAIWSGLGYNRRAKFLWQAAQIISKHGFPQTVEKLSQLPGIGPNTAGAIMTYAYNQPCVFVETNIRTVFIHHFFQNHSEKVTDAMIRELVAATLPRDNPREWYWALMDYGTHLKATVGAQLHKVHGHRPQSTFKGSRRQLRGQIIKLLLEGPHTHDELASMITDERLDDVLAALVQERLIFRSTTTYHI